MIIMSSWVLAQRHRPRLRVVAAVIALVLTGCGGSDDQATDSSGTSPLQVATAFYPLQYVAERIGGRAVQVSSLTPPGTEPHDLELTPRELADLQGEDLVVYLAGFQPAVDEAVTQMSEVPVLDASDGADLDVSYPSNTGDGDPGDAGDTGDTGGQLATDVTGSIDPHFWLDPRRLSSVAAEVADAMTAAAPEHGRLFAQNLHALERDLAALDAELAEGLSDCASRELVTSHAAFGYLAQRYGLEQVGITGLSPTVEPDPRQLAGIVAFVVDHDVRTVYTETLASPALADTVAAETGARTAVLDPIEGLGDASPGSDYLAIMRANLATLREGQPCR